MGNTWAKELNSSSLKRRNTYEEVFNTLKHKGNANQNNIGMPSRPIQNKLKKENKQQMLERIGRRDPCTLLVEYKFV
jgi:hypothetical protein